MIKLEDDDESSIQNESNEEEYPLEFIFKVKKLGKKGYSHKSRILRISEEGISYYQMVEKNKNTQIFLDSLTSLYTFLKNNTFDKNTYNQVVKNFHDLQPEYKKIKGFFQKYEIKSNEPISSFTKAPIRVFNADLNIDRDDPNNFWIMETKADCFRKAIKDAKKQIENYKKLKNQKKEEIKEERKEEIKDSNPREIKKVELNDEKDKIHYIGILFQGFMKQYLKQISKNNKNRIKILERLEKEKREKEEREQEQKLREEKDKYKLNQSYNNSREDHLKEREEKEKEDQLKDERIKEEKAREIRINQNKIKDEKTKEDDAKHQLYLELAIYYCYNQFVKHCEKIVQKIINDLGTFEKPDDITIQKKLHPIVFPNPYYYSQENNSVLLYSVWGVNYTLTWNNLSAKFKNTFTQSKGKWKGLKYQFRQKNYFQDFLIKLSTISDLTDEFPSIPMSCIIDFNGFRVYCESDIYATEEYLESLKLQMTQNSSEKGEMFFIKEISKLICENNNDVRNEKIEISNVIVNISSKTISDDKNFELESYISNVTNDFIRSFDKNIKNEIIGKNDRNQIVQTPEQFIKCVKKMISDNPIESENENFYLYVNNTEKNQPLMTFYYLMYFDILIPQLNTENVFYRQEIAINNIDFEKESGRKDKEYNLDNSSVLDTGRKISGPLSPKNQKNYMINNEDESSNNVNNNKEKEPLQILLNIIKNNTYQNNNDISNILEDKFQINLEFLIAALDSMYLIPYNSETLKIAFHYYGINLHYLGKVAERTKVPHIRELCLIEMFARVCKKIIFDLLGQSTFIKAMNAFYFNIKELTTTLHRVPLSFNISYGSDYLKSITQPVERVKFLYYNGVEITGLYMQGDEYPLKENKDKNDKKDNFDNEINQMKFQPLNNFFNLLLRMSSSKIKLELYNEEFTTTEELWNFIIENIKMRYDIVNDDVFMYCKDDSMSIFALLSAIQYHTGIKFLNGLSGILEKMGSQKFDNVIFESIQPSCKNNYYNFTYFLCKENVFLPLTNNFSLYYPGDLHYYQAKLNYYAEKYLYKKKISQNYYYLFYLKILKGWDTEKKSKNSHQNQIKEFDKNLTITDNVSLQVSPIFEDHFDNFISLIISQYQPKTQNRLNRNELVDSNIKNDSNYVYTCERIIQRYWNMKHPFISLLKSTFAKALYKNTNSRKDENKIDDNFLESVEIAKNAMGELNVFYGKLTRDVGLFFEKNFKFYKAYQMFNIAYKVFKKHKKIFKKDYYYSLKYLTKTCVYLGRLKEGLYYGTILVKEMIEDKELSYNDVLRNNDMNYSFIEENKKMEFWEEIVHHMNSFTFNLMKIAKSLKEYDICVTLGNLFFKKLENPINFILSPFKDWMKTSKMRVREMINIKNDQNNKGEIRFNTEIRLKEYGGKDKNIDNIIKVYLKSLFKGLKGFQHKTYTRAFVSFLDHCYNSELDKKNYEEINQMFYSLIFRKSNETFDQYFKNKLLYYLSQKYKSENFNKEEVEESYQKAKRELQIIYYKFPKKDSKLFINY